MTWFRNVVACARATRSFDVLCFTVAVGMLLRAQSSPAIAEPRSPVDVPVQPGSTGTALGLDLDGKPIIRLTHADTRLVVLLFTASDCPISNRYIPEINRLRGEFAQHGVAFWWVFPNTTETASIVRKHERAFSIEGDTVLDVAQTLVHMAHVTSTPEAAAFRVTGSTLKEIYRGRVDDRYTSFSKERPQAAEHYLEDAITAALAGRAIAHPVTRPVGCSIVPLAAGASLVRK